MSQYIDQRNAKIRKEYQKAVEWNKRIGKKHPGKAALTDLYRKYGALNLSFETFIKICRDPNYGRTIPPVPDVVPTTESGSGEGTVEGGTENLEVQTPASETESGEVMTP